MPPTGSSDEPRVTVAPPTVGDATSRKSGYLALMASGLITATAFAGIADIAGTTMNVATPPGPTQDYERAPSDPTNDDADLVPGNPSPERSGVAVSGAASTGDLATSKPGTTPTTVIMTNPDGTTTTTVIRPDGTTTTTTTTAGSSSATSSTTTTDGRSSTSTSSPGTSTSSSGSESNPPPETTTSDSPSPTTTTTSEPTTTSENETTTTTSEPSADETGGDPDQ